MNQITLGSLFDGSGGFTLGAIESGIIPVWASEIEPFPIRVTTKRMPHVKHYGDICQIRGDEIEPVDIITFGSPCQDMSIAGRRDGLNGNRSSLFYEAIRVIKEMREKTNGQKPRYIIWENVTGAFSSNKGEDYRRVLEEITKIKEPELSIPKPDGKWRKAGVIMGDNLSIAWRTVDAQYWGVPQRRKRIYLIADFAGQSAREILFEQESMQRDSDKSRKTKKTDTANIKGSTEKSSKIAICINDQGGQGSRYKGLLNVAPTGIGGNNQPFVVEQDKNSKTYSINKNLHHTKIEEGKTGTIVATDYKCPPIISRNMTVRKLTPQECGKLQGFPENWCSDLETIEPSEKDLVFWRDIFKTHRKISEKIKDKTDKQIVKWLKNPHSDSAEYKMWGNGVALPNVKFVLSSIKTYIEFRKEKL
ncbi:DNA (cytosine-5-)-methyltransferase [Eubacterium brachy ATCC 33089]|nr:DNA (cytosine-5-)-methyltransferase [Eubacterium brachy ATCC 33089]DAV88360.1 MAG TPA: Cytosine specific methyltransferase [Caudoviricetes sp.]